MFVCLFVLLFSLIAETFSCFRNLDPISWNGETPCKSPIANHVTTCHFSRQMANPCRLREKPTRASNRLPIKHQQEVFSPSKSASGQVQAHPSDTLSTTYRHIVSRSYIMFIYTLALLHLSLLHTLCPVIIY